MALGGDGSGNGEAIWGRGSAASLQSGASFIRRGASGMKDFREAIGFGGLRVLSLESRRADLMEQLIRRHDGDPFVAPSVKEIPFEQHDEVYRWAERLFANDFEMLVLMTGAGLTFLRDILAERYPLERFAEALRKVTIVSRGPKPAAVLHDMGGSARIMVPEPNTRIRHGGRKGPGTKGLALGLSATSRLHALPAFFPHCLVRHHQRGSCS